jgi:hypothetical protein
MGHSIRAADQDDFSGLDFLEGRKNGRKVLAEVIQAIGGRLENHNRDSATHQVLLVAEVCIHSDQSVKSSFRKLKSSPFCIPAQPAS